MIRVVNRAMHAFILDGWGKGAWRAAVQEAGLTLRVFDLMLDDPVSDTQRILACMAAKLGRSRDCLLEDFGTYLVAHPSWAPPVCAGSMYSQCRQSGQGYPYRCARYRSAAQGWFSTVRLR
jgi:hypothetical protein